MKIRLLAGFSVLAVALFGAANSYAQVDVSPGVARISLIHGDISTQRGDSGDWSAATLNQPVVTGDKISTGENSRSELQLDHANILRLGNRSEAAVANLARTQIQIQIGEGLADYSVFKGTEAEVEIDTPNAAVHPAIREGTYRIQVNSDHETVVTVRNGEANISTPQGSTSVKKGQVITVRGTGDDTRYMIADAPSKDEWDSWNNERDGAIRNAEAWRHTNNYYVGAEDLDAYGGWQTVPDYGPVWVPAVSVGWAPYRAGRWVWEPYWGWTWVSYEPWGWAPYHYGRWFLYGGRWAWWPGPVYGYPGYRPIWAPAYVSFFGFGGHSGFAVGFGSFGWLPIGPCDRFYPWYGPYRSRFNSVNITNVNITNVYVRNGRGFNGFAPLHRGNRYSNLRLVSTDTRLRQAVSTVPADRFGTGRVAATPVNPQLFRDGHVMTGNLPVVPTRQALSASNRPASAGTIARGGQQQRFFTTRQPAARPQSFDHQASQVQRALERNGRVAPASAGTAPQAGANVTRPVAPANGLTGRTSAETNAERTMPTRIGRGEASTRTEAPNSINSTGVSSGRAQENGWRRFGGNQGNATAVGQIRSESSRPVAQPPNNESQRMGGGNSAAGEKGGWRRFSDANPGRSGGYRAGSSVQSSETPSARDSSSSGTSRPRTMNEGSAGSSSSERNESWRRLSSQPRGQSTDSAPARFGAANQGATGNEEWRHATPRTEAPASRDFSSGGGRSEYRSGGGSSRPPLNMSQPIVTPRVSGGGSPRFGGGAGGGGFHSAPSHGGGGHAGAGGGHTSSGNRPGGR